MNKIVIVSTLKPIDDVRAYWKIGQSLAKTNKYEVNIIGNVSKNPPQKQNIHLHAYLLKRTDYIKRLVISWIILKKILSIKPQIIILCTHEPLILCAIYALIVKCKIVYDIQEDYLANALYLKKGPMKYFGYLVRWKEQWASRFINHFLLAESCYQRDIPFIGNRYTILENKAVDLPWIQPGRIPQRFLISGTISEYSGIQLALGFFEKYQSRFTSKLQIIGQVHDENLYRMLNSLSRSHTDIYIAKSPIPYPVILKAIKESSYGIIAYQTNRVNRYKIPTKVFEYGRFGLVSIFQEGCYWSSESLKTGNAYPLNFRDVIDDDLLAINNLMAKPSHTYPEESTWEASENKLLEIINTLLFKT